MKTLTAAVAIAVITLTAGNAFSLPINDRAADVIPVDNQLQGILNTAIAGTSPNRLDAITDQSNVANWTFSDSNASHTYLVSLAAAATSTTSHFGIYSVRTGAQYDLLNHLYRRQRGFSITDDGSLSIGDLEDVDPNFGTVFGFYFGTGEGSTTGNVFTEDARNGGNINALIYNVLDNTRFSNSLIGTTGGDDDWIMAFRTGSTGNFTEGVYFVKDLSPVPEPGTMLLLSAGVMGLAVYSKRRKNRD